jgi:2-iminobutanoate/2-iminopropanoate deaminase
MVEHLMIEYLNPHNLPFENYGLSPGVATNGFVFAAGMAIDFEKVGRDPRAITIADETRLCMDEIEAILHVAGCSLRDIVKSTCYLSDDSYRMEFLKAYTEALYPGPYPARCTFVVGIALGCRIEIDVIAVRPSRVGNE